MSDGGAHNPDLLALMREAYTRGVDAWSSALEDLVSSEEFAANSAQLLTLYAQQQEGIRTASRLAAESLHIPTAEDLARVAGLVANVERKVDEVSESGGAVVARLQAIEDRLGGLATASVVQTRLKAIESKVAALATVAPAAPTPDLDARLGAIEERIAAVATAPAAAPALPAELDARLAAIESRLAALASPPAATATKRTGGAAAKRTSAASKRTGTAASAGRATTARATAADES